MATCTTHQAQAGARERILIIDDDESSRRNLTFVLEKEGYDTDVAGTAVEAVRKAQLKCFDLALLDTQLPEMTGTELIAFIRKSCPEIAVIMVAARASVEGAVQALNDGACGYLVKPLNPDLALATIASALEKRQIAIENRRLYQTADRRLVDCEQVEEALACERDLLYALMDNIPDMIYFKDTASRFTRVNKTQVWTLGAGSVEEVVGRTDFDYFTPEHARAAYADEQRIVETGQPVVGKIEKIRRADGEQRWVSSTKVAIKNEQGRVTGIVGISRDITGLRQVEQALRHERDFTTQIVEIVPSGIIVVNQARTIIFANAQAARVLGLPIDQILQRTYDVASWHITDLDEQPFPDENLPDRRVMTTGQPVYGVPHVIERPDGQRVLLSVNATPLVGESGQVEGAVCSFEDITQRVRMAEEIESLARFPQENPNPIFRVSGDGLVLLANRSSQSLLDAWGCSVGQTLPEPWRELSADVLRSGSSRTIEIACGACVLSLSFVPITDVGYVNIYGLDITEHKRLEGQFLQAQKMETVGRLAGGVAHDFNNLLTAIGGYAAFVKAKLAADHPAIDDIQQVIRAADRAAQLTRQLLTFSRRQIMEQKVIGLNQLILEMDRMLRRLIGEDIELVTMPGRDLGWVKADPGQIEQVLVNLAVNARDAMPGGGKLTIETANVTLGDDYVRQHVGTAAGEYVMMAVSDTGSGMTEEIKVHIFEPFFTTKEEGRGTGLGLATVYGIVKQHQGNIWVYSEPGQGTTFKIYLPRVKAANEGRVPKSEEMWLPRGDETVLVVEDESTVRRFAVQSLRELGYTVLEAASGDEALLLFQKCARVDLLLTDVVMPKMNGKMLAAQLQQLSPDIEVLFTSGYTDNAVVHQGVLDEGVAFLQKPFTAVSLARKVHELLHRGCRSEG